METNIGGHRGLDVIRYQDADSSFILKKCLHEMDNSADAIGDLYGLNETAIHNEAMMLDIMKDSGFTPDLIDIKDGEILQSDVGVTEPPTDAETWRQAIVFMLAGIRARGLRHGDLKGSNIITVDNKPWAIDWQESHYLTDVAPQRAPLSDSYMAMQHIEGTLDIDGRFDIPRVARRWRTVLDGLGARAIGLPLQGKTFLDLGCFQGDFVALAAAEGMAATGVDAGGFREHENSIEIGKELWKGFPFGEIHLTQADIASASVGAFDVAMCFSTWPYIVQDYGKVKAEMVLSDLIMNSGVLFFETQLHGDGPGPEFLKTDEEVEHLLMWLGANDVKALATYQVSGRPGMRTVWRAKH